MESNKKQEDKKKKPAKKEGASIFSFAFSVEKKSENRREHCLLVLHSIQDKSRVYLDRKNSVL